MRHLSNLRHLLTFLWLPLLAAGCLVYDHPRQEAPPVYRYPVYPQRGYPEYQRPYSSAPFAEPREACGCALEK